MAVLTMNTVRAYIDREDRACVRCTACGRRRVVKDVSRRLPGLCRTAEVSCRCGNSFRVLFERRYFLRKQTSLSGRCWSPSTPDSKTPMVVRDQSITGLRLELDEPGPRVNDLLWVEYSSADDSHRWLRQVRVRRVDGSVVGVEFMPPADETVDPEDAGQ